MIEEQGSISLLIYLNIEKLLNKMYSDSSGSLC